MKKVSYYFDGSYPMKCIVELNDTQFEELRKEVLERQDEETCISTREGEYGKYMSCDLAITATPYSNIPYCTTVREYLELHLKPAEEEDDDK